MITKTSEEILTPLAETVSQLIIYVEESNRTGSPLPDLTTVTTAVAASVLNLVKAGRDIAAKEPAASPRAPRMISACDQLQKASEMLSKASVDLKNNSLEKRYKNDLMESVRLLLSGTQNILDVNDDIEIEKILSAAKNTISNLSNYREKMENFKVLVSVAKPTSESISMLMQLTKERIPELIDRDHQSVLETALTNLNDNAVPLMLVAKASVLQPWNDASREARISKANFMIKAAERIMEIVNIRSVSDAEALKEADLLMVPDTVKIDLVALPSGESGLDGLESWKNLRDQLIHIYKAVEEGESPEVVNALFLAFKKDLEYAIIAYIPKTCTNHSIVQVKNTLSSSNIKTLEQYLEKVAQNRTDMDNRKKLWTEGIAPLKNNLNTLERNLELEWVGALNNQSQLLDSAPVDDNVAKASGLILSVPGKNSQSVAAVWKSISDGGLSVNEATIIDLKNSLKDLMVTSYTYARLVPTNQKSLEKEIQGLLHAWDDVELALKGVLAENKKIAENPAGIPDAVKGTTKDFAKVTLNNWHNQVKKFQETLSDAVPSQAFITYHAKLLENAEKIEGKETVMKSSNKQLVDHLKKHEIDNTGNVEYEADLSVAISEYESKFEKLVTDPGNKSLLEETLGSLEKIDRLVRDRNDYDSTPLPFHSTVREVIAQVPGEEGHIGISKVSTETAHEAKIESTMTQSTNTTSARKFEGISSAVSNTPTVNTVPKPSTVTAIQTQPISTESSKDKQRGSLGSLTNLSTGSPVTSSPLTKNPSNSNLKYGSSTNLKRGSSVNLRKHGSSVSLGSEEMLAMISKRVVKAEVIMVHAEPPSKLTEEEALMNPIKAVAQELLVSASVYSEKDNPLIKKLNELHPLMSKLSDCYRLEDTTKKKALLDCVKDITTKSKELMDDIILIAEHCSDKRLQKHLLLNTEKIPLILTQFKITAAVKASAPKDLDTERQLTIITQNLLQSIQTCLNSCQSASIRLTQQKVRPVSQTAQKIVDDSSLRRASSNKSLREGDILNIRFVRQVYTK